jgi:hypothetical protein
MEAVQQALTIALNRALELFTPPLPPTLYHYTTPEACFGILHGKSTDGAPSVWASSAFCMNDASEIVYGLEVVGQVASQYGPAGGGVLDEEFRYLETAMVVSFSSDPDLLSQWRAYARNGAGCAIGFNRDRLVAAGAEHSFRLLPVIYDPAMQREILREFFEHAEGPWPAVLASASLLALSFKNRGFQEEVEWRLATAVPSRVLFRSGPSGVIPYTILGLTKDCITELWQGPTLDQQMAGRAWEFYLRSEYGETPDGELKVRLHSSTLPLRLL